LDKTKSMSGNIMNSEKKSRLDFFLSEVDRLYTEIKAWISGYELLSSESDILITEKKCGEYQTKKLTLSTKDGTRIAEIVPIGAWVVGANGRIDIIGLHDRIIIVHLDKGGPSFNFTFRVPMKTDKRFIYKGIDEAGWYWFEHKLSSKGHKLTAELFFEILADISDYERD